METVKIQCKECYEDVELEIPSEPEEMADIPLGDFYKDCTNCEAKIRFVNDGPQEWKLWKGGKGEK